MPIVRIWRGFASPDRPDAYPQHFRSRVVPELRDVGGFLGADLVRREVGELIEFTVLTRWRSMDAVAAFAGSDPGRAVVEPGAVEALHHFDDEVTHHDVVEHLTGPS